MTQYPYGFSGQAWTLFWGWVAIVAISLSLVALAIDQSGAKSWNHAEGVPAGVVQLTKTAYLIDNRTSVTPSEICRGTASSGSDNGIDDTSKVPTLDNSLYVQCIKGQTWGDARARSMDYGHALVKVATTPMWFVAILVIGILFTLPCLTVVFKVKRGRRQRRKEQREWEKAKIAKRKANQETLRKELRLSYAHGEIDELTFLRKMDDLYEGKLPPDE